MEEKATLIESLVDRAEVYTKSSVDLLKLKAIDKSAKVLSSVFSTFIITIAVLCIILMINIGAALWIGKLIDSSFCGFFIVAAFYTFVTIILCTFRKTILKRPFSNRFITHIRKDLNI